MRQKYTYILILFLTLGFVSACDDDDDVEIGYTATYPLSGDWTVTLSLETAPGQFEPLADHLELLIYNTSENVPTEVWIDDHGNIDDFKVKTPSDARARTFGGSSLTNENGDNQISIANGQVFLDAVRVNEILRDSIYFQLSFSDDTTPGTVYHVYGHRSTGFE
ncbi:lipid-binding protein [Pontibacter populi]|uniref:Lipid-binding protein n=1 Tax=Pontibacter populi TaxID=890055 RepID=A0ABV1RNU6_9BACT